MTRRTLVVWGVEFVAVTVIAIVLSTATTASKWWATLPAAAIVVTKITEYVHTSRVRLEIVRHQLQVFLMLLPGNGSRIRCTYHYPIYHRIRRRTDLVQAFDYLPDGGGGGRPFPTTKGIIGKAYFVKGPRVENFASDEEYRQRMVSEYNYSTAELMKRTVDRRSYACYPLLDENHDVLGLIYLDSDTEGTFTMDATNPRWTALSAAGEVIRANVLQTL